MSISIVPQYRYMYHMHVWETVRSEDCIASPVTGFTHGCELTCGCCETNQELYKSSKCS